MATGGIVIQIPHMSDGTKQQQIAGLQVGLQTGLQDTTALLGTAGQQRLQFEAKVSQDVQAIVAAWQAGAISQDTMFDLFRRGEVLPEGRTNEEEAALLEQQRREDAKNGVASGTNGQSHVTVGKTSGVPMGSAQSA